MMEDILIIDNNSIEETVIDETEYKDYQPVDSDISIDKGINKDKLKEEESIYEFKQVNQSDDIILGSNVNNYIDNSKNISVEETYLRSISNNPLDYDIEGYNSSILWSGGLGQQFTAQNLSLNDSIDNYDYIGIVCRLGNNTYVLLVFPADVNTIYYPSVASSNLGYSTYRLFNISSLNTIYVSDCFRGNTTDVFNSQNIPVYVIGYKYNTVSNNEIPIVSGNNINNYYIYVNGVSENAVSWNLINKPINEYNVQESFMLLSFTFAFCVSLYLLIRKAVFRWR